VSSSSLAAVTLAQVTDQLQQYGSSSLKGDHQVAVQALLKALEDGLTGNLSPEYHLSAMDPGVGKSLSVATFLKVWKGQGFTPSSSVLIGLSRLEEIKSYMREAGLDRGDIAVLTSEPEYNELGVPKEQHGSAPVMFTTQQMIERRTRGQSFADTSEFHFQGRPRALRVWDESLVPAERLVLGVDDVGALLVPLRGKSPAFAKEVQAMLPQLWALTDGGQFRLPEAFATPSVNPRSLLGSPATTFETLRRLAGKVVTATHSDAAGIQLIGVGDPLPADFPPVIILDASGRVRSTYQVWERAGGPLRRLPAAIKDYRNLRVHLWERPVGKLAMREPGALEDVVKAVAEVVVEHPTSNWLIVHYKDQPVDRELPKVLEADLRPNVRFLTWGVHLGTNAFKDCTRVVLLGQLTYNDIAYRALAAACGASFDDDEAQQEVREGEYRHHLLQALTRASVRRNENGRAKACTAYVISSPNVGASAVIPEVFRGCTVERWSPNVPAVNGRAGQLIALLEAARTQRVAELAKKDLRETLGLLPPNFSKLLKQRDVKEYLDRSGMHSYGNRITLPPRFEPYPGGGFTTEDLEDDPE
jgi:hypothetical protein